VTDVAIECLRSCPQLECVVISDTGVTTTGLNQLKELLQLKDLCLRGKNVTDDWLELLAKNGQLQRMRSLDLWQSRVTDAGLAFLKLSPCLDMLTISNTT